MKNASHNVNSATGKVVATTNAGREQLDEDKDILVEIAQSISLTQIKRQEMDSQVKKNPTKTSSKQLNIRFVSWS